MPKKITLNPDGQAKTKEKVVNSKAVFHIYYSTWTEAGRASNNCEGWGLCNYTDCWFCWTDDNGNIVPSGNQAPPTHNFGIAVFQEGVNEGIFTIELSNEDSEQAAAILDQKTLYIDEDVENSNFRLPAGEYTFDVSIGDNGGYQIPVFRI